MKTNAEEHRPCHGRWGKLAIALRRAGVAEPVAKVAPPPGLVTRIVARTQADGRADAVGLVRWRRWTVLGAGAAVACLVISFYAVPAGNRDSQFMPVPTMEFPKKLTE